MHKITKFSIHKTSLTVAVIFAVTSIFFIVPIGIITHLLPATDQNGQTINAGMPIWLIIAAPFFYLIFGYLSTAAYAWIYNILAKYTGGITFELSQNKNS